MNSTNGTVIFNFNGPNFDLIEIQATNLTGNIFNASVFNLPRTAKGTAYISMIKQSSVTLAQSIKAQIAIVHADLSVTNISSEFETTQTLAISPTKTTDLLALPLTQTTIKKGEKLRMILKIVIDASGGNGFLFHDNADSTKILHLLMPFRRIES